MPLETPVQSKAASCEFRFESLNPQPAWHTMTVNSSAPEQKFPSPLSSSCDRIFRKIKTTQPFEVSNKRLNEFIGFELSLVSEIEYVFTAFRNAVFYVWVVLNQFEQGVRERIYEREKAIIDEFPMFEFDFYIISRMGRNARDLISESIELVYEKSRVS